MHRNRFDAATFRWGKWFFALTLFALLSLNGDLKRGLALEAALRDFRAAPRRLAIAADGGLRHLYKLEIAPDIVIGDMDSAPPKLLAQAQADGAQIIRHPPEKDETDLELALLTAARCGATTIRLIGAVGDRLDQTVSNVYLMALPALQGRDVRIVSGAQTTWLAAPGVAEVRGKAGDTLSLVPLGGETSGIYTDGLRYPLHGETLHFGPTRGVSNVLLSDVARISFERGLLLLIHTVGRA